MAQRNVEQHYAFVGLTEAFRETLQLAEVLLPDYFRDARKKYDSIGGCIFSVFTRVQFWPSGIVVACVCLIYLDCFAVPTVSRSQHVARILI